MTAITGFSLTKSFKVFDHTWQNAEFIQIANENSNIQVGDSADLIAANPPAVTPRDIWGINWSKIPQASWNNQMGVNPFRDYKVAYLRFVVTVFNGTPGDSILFIFNQPNTTVNSGVHAQVHVEVTQDTALLDRKRSTGLEQHFIKCWEVSQYTTITDIINRMHQITEVRLLGISKTNTTTVRVQCFFLGGMY